MHGDYMKVLVISDIHGHTNEFKSIIEKEHYDKLIILGDLFEYGDDYDEEIINVLKENKRKLILIKGNCDYFIDYTKYDLYAHEVFSITLNNHVVTLTHGHLYNKGFLPDFHGDIFISGHTHVPLLTKENNIIYANPGSIGKPRGFSNKSYLIFNDNKLILKTISGEIIKEMII